MKNLRFAAILAIALIPTSFVAAETKAVLTTHQLPASGQSIVWSPLFQASWDKLNQRRQGKLEKVTPPNKLMAALDSYKWNESEVMPDGGYAVFAGPSTPEFATDVRKRVLKRFKFSMPENWLPYSDNGESVYGVLVRDLNFKQQFFRSRSDALKFQDRESKIHEVAYFGTAGSYSNKFGNNVDVLRYDDKGQSFILSIRTDVHQERLIIYRPDRALSFDMAISHINAAIKAPLAGPTGSIGDSNLHKNDTVKIPYLNIKTDTDFTDQLRGQRHYTGEPLPWTITKAYQITKFELFEKGARVRVETGTSMEPFGGIPAKPRKVIYVPRQFICDRPFFVFTWKEKSPLPYFSAWVDSKDVLENF